jgi:hypothetical protein
MDQTSPKPDSRPETIQIPQSGTAAVRSTERPHQDLLEALHLQKELAENLEEVIQVRDLEIKYLQNTIGVQERLLENYPQDRVFGAVYDLYLRFNELFPKGTRRRRIMGRFVDLLARR